MLKECSLSTCIMDELDLIATEVIDLQYERVPALFSKYGNSGKNKSINDVRHHLIFLANACNYESPELFMAYIDWLKILFKHLGLPSSYMMDNLDVIKEVLENRVGCHRSHILFKILDSGKERLLSDTPVLSCYLEKSKLPSLVKEYNSLLLNNDEKGAYKLIMDSVEQGIDIRDIYLYVFQCSQFEIGRLWQLNSISVAKEHFCTAATQKIMAQLYPFIFSGSDNGHNVVAACVGTELHEIGIRMVADFFEIEGWNTHYLGANTPVECIIHTLKEVQADILLLSVTMVAHLSMLGDLIMGIRDDAGIKNTCIIVGGYPFNVDRELWKKVGADAYARNAKEAVEIADSMLRSLNKHESS
nr:cobalamin-dependent protein [uncultured Methanolobus sp.]